MPVRPDAVGALNEVAGRRAMSPQRFAVLPVLCGTLVLNGWVAVGLTGLGSPAIENGAARIAADTPRATAIAKESVDGVSNTETAVAALPSPREAPAQIASPSTPDPVQN